MFYGTRTRDPCTTAQSVTGPPLRHFAQASRQCCNSFTSQYSFTLECLDIKRVKEIVYPARAKWRYIGLELGLTVNDLLHIESTVRGSNDSRLTCMLVTWLERESLSPSWGSLLKALRAIDVDREDLAQLIEEKYLKKELLVTQEQSRDMGKLISCPKDETARQCTTW